jgi:hypothetical protein
MIKIHYYNIHVWFCQYIQLKLYSTKIKIQQIQISEPDKLTSKWLSDESHITSRYVHCKQAL